MIDLATTPVYSFTKQLVLTVHYTHNEYKLYLMTTKLHLYTWPLCPSNKTNRRTVTILIDCGTPEQLKRETLFVITTIKTIKDHLLSLRVHSLLIHI